jgi:hypothetical protein
MRYRKSTVKSVRLAEFDEADRQPSVIKTQPSETETHTFLQRAPTQLIPQFIRKAAEEIPWHVDEKIDARDIERALRAVREHFERTYPQGTNIDWMGLSENCKLRLHFTVLDHLDFNCPTLAHLVHMRETTRQELIEIFIKAADMAEERIKLNAEQYDAAQRAVSRGMNYACITPTA